MPRYWTNEHGEDGLRDKFSVYKTKDGERLYRGAYTAFSPGDRIGADGEFVFVLRPETDLEAWTALWDYAAAVEFRAPQLTRDIQGRLSEIAVHNAKRPT